MKKQTQEQGPPAGRTVWKISLNVGVKNMQRNDKNIEELLNAHIREDKVTRIAVLLGQLIASHKLE